MPSEIRELLKQLKPENILNIRIDYFEPGIEESSKRTFSESEKIISKNN